MQIEERSPSVASGREGSSLEQKKQSMSNLQMLWKQREQDYVDKLTILADEKAILEGRVRDLVRGQNATVEDLQRLQIQLKNISAENKELASAQRKAETEVADLSHRLAQKERMYQQAMTAQPSASQPPQVDPTVGYNYLFDEWQNRCALIFEASNGLWKARYDHTREIHTLEVAAIRAANRSHVTSINFKRVATMLHNARLKQMLDGYRNREEELGQHHANIVGIQMQNQQLEEDLGRFRRESAEASRQHEEALQQAESFKLERDNLEKVLIETTAAAKDLREQNDDLVRKLAKAHESHDADLSECVAAFEKEVSDQKDLIQEDRRRFESIISDKNEEIQALKDEAARSKEENKTKTQALAAMTKDVQSLKEQNEIHARQTDQVSQREKELGVANQKLRRDFDALSDANIAQQEENHQLQEKLNRLEQELRSLRAERHTQQLHAESLQAQLETTERRATDQARNQGNEIKVLRQQNAEQVSAIESLEKEVLTVRQQEKHLRKDLSTQESARSAIEGENAALKDHLEQEKQRAKANQSTLQKLTRDKDTLIASNKGLEDELHRLQDSERKSIKEMNILKAENASLDTRVQELSELLANNQSSTTTKQRLLNEELTDLRNMRETLESKIEGLEGALAAARASEAKIKAERQALSDECAVLIENQEGLRTERNNLEGALRRAQMNVTDGKELVKAAEVAEERVKVLESENSVLKTNASKLEQQIKHLKEDIVLLEELQTTEKSRSTEAGKKVHDLESRVLHLTTTMEDLSSELENQKRSLAAKDRSLAALKDQHVSLQQELDVTQEDRIELEKSSDAYLKLLSEKEATCRTQASEISALEEEVALLKDQLHQISEASRLAVRDNDKRVRELSDEVARYKTEGNESQSTIRQLQTSLQKQSAASEDGISMAASTLKASLLLLEDTESYCRDSLEALWFDALGPIFLDQHSVCRRSTLNSQHSKQMRQRLEALARDKQQQEAESAAELQRVQEEAENLAEELEDLSHSVDVQQDLRGREAMWSQYLEGRTRLLEDQNSELWAMLNYVPKSNHASEARARTTLALLGNPAQGAIGSNGGDIDNLRSLSKSLRATKRELDLVTHLYRTEKQMEACSLQRAVGRLALQNARVSQFQSPSSLHLALRTLEESEEATRLSLASAFGSCLASIEIAMLPLIDPLNFL